MLESVREYIRTEYGRDYLPAEASIYKSKKSAQDAHEAIRPTSLEYSPERVQGFLDKDEFRLYQLIWNRFVASQMQPAVYELTTVDLITTDKKGRIQTFRASGSVIKFPGFTAVYQEGAEEAVRGKKKAGEDSEPAADSRALKLPPIQEGDAVQLKELDPSQHFTQPPGRFSDASLIRELEERGIGRPSTYASILSNLQDREYVEKRENRYYPSELGVVVTDLLVQSFPDILDSEFTADMENQLDEIEEGKADWKKTLRAFWKPFEKTLETAKIQMKNVKRQEVPTDLNCDRCSHKFVIKWGKQGSFLACSNYPECKNAQDFKKDDQGKIVIIPKEFTDKTCPECKKPMIVKNGKFGKFLACSDYPNCKVTQAIGTGVPCPACKEGEIVEKQSRYRRIFYSCGTWPKCNYALWDKPLQQPCPKCQWPILTMKITKKNGLVHKCPQKECGFYEVIDPLAGQRPAGEPGEGEAAESA
jgi:DNA topoisomerase-1